MKGDWLGFGFDLRTRRLLDRMQDASSEFGQFKLHQVRLMRMVHMYIVAEIGFHP